MKPIEFVYNEEPLGDDYHALGSFKSEWIAGQQYITIRMPVGGSVSFTEDFWDALNNHVKAGFSEPSLKV